MGGEGGGRVCGEGGNRGRLGRSGEGGGGKKRYIIVGLEVAIGLGG